MPKRSAHENMEKNFGLPKTFATALTVMSVNIRGRL